MKFFWFFWNFFFRDLWLILVLEKWFLEFYPSVFEFSPAADKKDCAIYIEIFWEVFESLCLCKRAVTPGTPLDAWKSKYGSKPKLEKKSENIFFRGEITLKKNWDFSGNPSVWTSSKWGFKGIWNFSENIFSKSQNYFFDRKKSWDFFRSLYRCRKFRRIHFSHS